MTFGVSNMKIKLLATGNWQLATGSLYFASKKSYFKDLYKTLLRQLGKGAQYLS